MKKFQYQSLRTDKNIDCCPDTILGDFLERFNDKEEQANAAGDGAGDRKGLNIFVFDLSSKPLRIQTQDMYSIHSLESKLFSISIFFIRIFSVFRVINEKPNPDKSGKSEKSRVIMRKCIVGDYCNIEYEARPSDRKSDISIQNCIIMR